jgi:hypothetical protein
MNKFYSSVSCVLVTFGLAVPLTAVPQFGRDSRGRGSVCVYKDINYQGLEQCFNNGDTLATLQSLNKQISSMRLNGRTSVTVYDATNFGGHSATFTTDMPDLGQIRLDNHSWSDRIQSMEVGVNDGTSGTYPNNAPVYGGGPPYRGQRYPKQGIREGVCVYDRAKYQGHSECWNSGERLANLSGWNNRISSIRVFGRTTAIAYRDPNFRGASMFINRDIPDMRRNWNNEISSLRIENERGSNNVRGYRR